MPQGLSRRDWLRTGLAGSCGTVAAWSVLQKQAEADEARGKPSSLTITKVETFALEHKLPRAIGPSVALSNLRDALLVKISTDSGLVGWGETADVGGTRGIIEDHLKNVLLGKNPFEHRKLWGTMWGANFGDGRAVAGCDLALHDLRGKALGLSIADLYGGRQRDKVMGYAAAMNYTEGVKPEDQHPPEAAALARQGFRAMKIRTGRFGYKRDLAVMQKIREAVGPDVRLLTDGNGAFTLPQAVKFGKELEKLDFYCFEEPLPQAPNYAGYDVLTESLDIAVSGGEVLDSRATAREHIVRRSFDIIQPDVSLCGGIAEVLFIAEMARLFGIQALPHCWAGAITIAATLQVNSLLSPHFPGFAGGDEPMLEFDVYENPFRDEIVAKKFELKQGYFDVPTGPGLGIEIVEDVVRKYAKK
ncbi:MAG: mandelate racemase/muconate lactonizing enzyme family protein [Planctomycetaceae bacterium]|nr:mandelate racemase/muconate lactonizing enzyme family protein [Planctomycetaceae bacterium]